SMSRPASSSRCMSHAEIRVPSTSGRQPIGCRVGRVSSQLWISARAASRAASPALTRSASQPKPCQAASHSGPAPDGNQAGAGGSAALDEAGAVEAIDAVIFGKMAGKGAQIALGRDPVRRRAELARLNWATLDRGARAQERFDPLLPFLRLKRAGAVDQGAAR